MVHNLVSLERLLPRSDGPPDGVVRTVATTHGQAWSWVFAGLCVGLWVEPTSAQEAPSQVEAAPGAMPAEQAPSQPPPGTAPAEVPEAAPTERERGLEQRVKELESRLDALSSELESESLERIVQEAKQEAQEVDDEARPEQREFLEGGLALQKLNPELTVSADVLGVLVVDGKDFYATESDRSGIFLRGLGVHFEHVLDPFSRFKSALHFSPDHGVGVEEVYVTWSGLIPTTSLAAGRFRQNFGILNRWHEHDLDQSSYPSALRLVLGEEGLVGDGLMVRWLMPTLWAHANELTLEVVDGANETLFSGEHFSVPSTMAHLKNYYDLSPSTYLELGLTGMFGFNNRRGLLDEQSRLVNEPWRQTFVGGTDLTLFWSPPQRAKYDSFTWRSEAYFAGKELPAESQHKWSKSFGVYSYLQYQLSEQWFAGVRGDVARPTVRDTSELAWDVVPYATFWQSEFVYLRLEAQHGRLPYESRPGTLALRTDNRVLLQLDFAAGPHKHEKY